MVIETVEAPVNPSEQSFSQPEQTKAKPWRIIVVFIFVVLIIALGMILLPINNRAPTQNKIAKNLAPTLFETKTKFVTDLETDLQKGDYVLIPNTDLEIKIPTDFLNQPPSPSFYINLTPVLSFIKKGAPITEGLNSLAISTVTTPLSPKEWVQQNVAYQGIEWNESFGTGKEITINNLSFFSVDVACCGGYEQTYIYSTNDMLILFSTNDRQGLVLAKNENEKSDRNIILDEIVSTLKTKTEKSF